MEEWIEENVEAICFGIVVVISCVCLGYGMSVTNDQIDACVASSNYDAATCRVELSR